MNYQSPDFNVDEPKKAKRGRPRVRKKLPPFKPGEKERLVEEYLAKGGVIKTFEIQEMDPKLQYQHPMRRDKSVSVQVPWLQETSSAIKKEDADFAGFDD